MKNKRIKNLIIIMFSILGILLISIFLYLLIQSSFYKLECTRINDGVFEGYDFEFNVLRKINKPRKITVMEHPSEKSAKEHYELVLKTDESNVELDGKRVIFTSSSLIYDFKDDLKLAHEDCTNWGYSCRMVRK